MRGYFVGISNNLLEPRHRLAMGESLWLFAWFLDKMTSIDKNGIGKVLGGKPIKYSEVNAYLDLSRKTYLQWVKKLEKGGYINTKRAPYGLIISVNKAKKKFGNRVDKNDTSGYAQSDTSNKDNNSIDNKQLSTKVDRASHFIPNSYGNEKINQAYSFFEEKLGGSLDGGVAENRRYAYLLIGKLEKDYPNTDAIENICALIEGGLKDDFIGKNLTSFKYLYKHTQNIIQTIKHRRSRVIVI